MDKDKIAYNLVRLRKERNLSATLVAQKLDVDGKKYVAWEMGIETPGVEDIMKISDMYGIDYTDLLAEPVTKKGKSSLGGTASKEKQVSFQKWGAITASGIAALLLILYIVPFAKYSFGYFSETPNYYDLLKINDGGSIAIMVFLLVIPTLIFLDNIIKLFYIRARYSAYGKVSNIISLILSLGFIGTVIGFLVKYNIGYYGNNIAPGMYIVPIFAFIFGIMMIVLSIMNLKKKEFKRKQNKKKKD